MTAGSRSACISRRPTSTRRWPAPPGRGRRHRGRPPAVRTAAPAAGAGATVERPATDAPYGRTGVVLDPYGHRWMLQTPAPAADAGLRPGDVVYLTLQVPDGARARDFYEAVLGWSFTPGRVED